MPEKEIQHIGYRADCSEDIVKVISTETILEALNKFIPKEPIF